MTQEPSDPPDDNQPSPLPFVRTGLAGLLMGLANLVPGVSGGTMIVVMGLYDDFIGSIADVSALRFTRRNITFLAIVVCFAGVAIGGLAGTVKGLVAHQQSAMFSLFIGMTLGGTPALMRMVRGGSRSQVVGAVIGLLMMLAIVATRSESPDRSSVREAVESGALVVEPAYGLDFGAGVLGVSAMVLPGISGAYMLLILGRYESTLAAVELAKLYVLSGGDGDPLPFLRVIIPVGLGVLVGAICLSNFLKWMLRVHRELTVGVLLGILFGSVVGIWPFDATSGGGDVALGLLLAVVGFVATLLLSRISA